jgi:hypothetical protein
MGPSVLRATIQTSELAASAGGGAGANSSDAHAVRAYAHCAPTGAPSGPSAPSLSLLLINTDASRSQSHLTLRLPTLTSRDLVASVDAKVWVLSGPGGTNSSRLALNGRELDMTGSTPLPRMEPREITLMPARGDGELQLPTLAAATIVFFSLDSVGVAMGCH